MTAVCAASAHTLANPARKMSSGANHDSSAGVEVTEEKEVKVKEEEEEETLGQLRDRQALASARASMPGPRAVFVHIKVEDSSSGEDMDGKGGGGDGEGDGKGEVQVKQEEDQVEPRDLRALVPCASLKVVSEAVRPQSLSPGARSGPGSSLARLRVPKRLAANDVQDNDVQQDDMEEEEAGLVPELAQRILGFSRLKGVTWVASSSKWQVKCKGKYLGLHTTEEAAARAYSKYLQDGVAPVVHREARASQLAGVSWVKSASKWRAACKGTYLGLHSTEEAAAHAYNKYLEDGAVPGYARSTQFRGVSWNTNSMKWRAAYKQTYLGLQTTEEGAARAYSQYVKDGVVPRYAGSSQFTGVSWNTSKGSWQAHCKGTYMGKHTTEAAAAQAYNVEAERLGRPINVIPPAEGAAGAGAGPGAG